MGAACFVSNFEMNPYNHILAGSNRVQLCTQQKIGFDFFRLKRHFLHGQPLAKVSSMIAEACDSDESGDDVVDRFDEMILCLGGDEIE